ncbi:MAG: ADP-heptose--LPS heptosyltransferase [Nitrospirales bacterium]|nr:MAG: ADP-heptose--LPS heptosyltransferase [Nitrospirales bacterium]
MIDQDITRILIRAPNWIGDAVMCTPALMDIRECYPRATITLLARPAIAELLHGHPGINDVLLYQHQRTHAGILGKARLIRKLRSQKFQIAILLQNAFEAAFLTMCAGIPERWGYGTDGRSVLLSKAVPTSRNKKSIHQVRYYQLLIQQVLGRTLPRRMQLAAFDQDEECVNQRFPEIGAGKSEYVIGLNPGSVYGSSKRWVPGRFAELADRVVDHIRQMAGSAATVKCVLVGGTGEESLAQTIASLMQETPIVLSGKTTLRELMVIIKRCSLFITNDTGPMHIAAAFNVPLVAIFGSTDPGYTAPFGWEDAVVQDSVRCAPCFLRSCPIDHRCMTQISVQQAFDMALCQLSRNVKANHDA